MFLIILLTLPNILAQWGSWGYFNSPEYYFDNPLVMFAIVFLIFFGVVFYTVNKAFKNTPVSAVIAIAISLLIAITLTKRGWLYGYAGEEIGVWILVVVFLLIIGFLIRFAFEAFGYLGPPAAVLAIWFILKSIDPYEIIPYEIADNIVPIYEIITSIFGGIILVAITFMISKTQEGSSPGEKMISTLFKRH